MPDPYGADTTDMDGSLKIGALLVGVVIAAYFGWQALQSYLQ